jgi:two-component system response regulator HydG
VSDTEIDDLAVLVVEDDPAILASLEKVLTRERLNVLSAENGRQALELVREHQVAVIVTDFQMPGMSGLDLLRSVKMVSPETEVILITAYGTIELAVEAMKKGAYDFVVKPFKRHDIVSGVRRALEKQRLVVENRQLRAQLDQTLGKRHLIGQSLAMRQTLEFVDQVAPSSATVMLTGESGTGKELVARALHMGSSRAARPFVAINCAAIPDTILEAELFGYEKGAFTGAVSRKEGRFERAHTGTLFLDEIGEIAPHAQVKLLRVLQEGEVERLGSTKAISVDCRIIASTNRDLDNEVKLGRFREDLYYRLNVISIHLPPLRDRLDDVPLLAHHFLSIYSEKNARTIGAISQDALDLLSNYAWPGNVRELENVIERAVVLAKDDVIGVADLPAQVRSGGGASRSVTIPLGMPLDEVEQRLIQETLKMTDGDKRLAAQLLGIATRTIYRKQKSQDDPSDEGEIQAEAGPVTVPEHETA